MAEYAIYVVSVPVRPGSAATAETFHIYKTVKGDRIIACDFQKTTLAAASTNSDFTVGDATDPDGFCTAVDTESGSANDYVDNSGAYLTLPGGKLYNSEVNIYATYTPNSTPGATIPAGTVRLWVAKG